MAMFVVFALGYFIGARNGKKEFDDLARSLTALRQSEEFADLVMAARSHISHTLHELAVMVDGGDSPADGDQDLVAHVKSLFGDD
jgi:hypothetical protein